MGSPDSGAISAESRKRTNNACVSCRERKVRCSGTMPCKTCIRRHEECVFEPGEKKVVISSRTLAELKRKSNLLDSGDPGQHAERRSFRRIDNRDITPDNVSFSEGVTTQDAASIESCHTQGASPRTQESDPAEFGLPEMDNPLATGPSRFLTDVWGRRRFLGPSSTWAYSRQVMTIIHGHLRQHESAEMPISPDGHALTLDWPSVTQIGPLAMEKLPSLDYALYLTNTVKFHLGQMYHVFDEQIFMHNLYHFYSQGPHCEPIPKARVWYVHYLIIMGFGKALLSGCIERRPVGSDLVSRAIELLPDGYGLYDEPVSSIEVLSCLGLYLQSIDHRNSAFFYIGQAFRIALSQGLHRELVGTSLEPAEIERHRWAWWSLYVLDRRFSSLMGAPNSIQDTDITAPLPTTGNNAQTTRALGIHVALSRLLARVLHTVYRADEKPGLSLLKSIQVILRDMVDVARMLSGAFELKFDSSEPTSRVSATLNLYYHQCIVLATRPILISLLRDGLVRSDGTRQIAEPVKSLLMTSKESATKSLRILSILLSQNLLESFLPFDLELTFSCAFVLSLMSALPLFPTVDNSFIQTTFKILDAMHARGNVVARNRKEELEMLLDTLSMVQQETSPPSTPVNRPQSTGNAAAPTAVETSILDRTDMHTSTTSNGLCPDHLLSVAQRLEWDLASSDLYDATLGDDWLWNGVNPAGDDMPFTDPGTAGEWGP